MPCKCGSDSHKRINAKACPLNPKRQRVDSAATLIPTAPKLDDIPPEIKIAIVDCVPIGDVWMLGQLSRSFRQLISSKQYWIKRPLEEAVGADGRPVRICQSTACQRYRLSVNDLADLEYATCRNPHYRSATPMKLFNIGLVEGLAYAKHGGPPGVTLAHIKLEERREKLAQSKIDKTAKRRKELTDALRAKGLQLRSDSRISEYYISGSKQAYSLEKTVETAERMHIIHTHSNYKRLLDQSYEEIQQEIRDARSDYDYDRDFGYRINFHQEWEEAKDSSEHEALCNFEREFEKFKALSEADQKRYKVCSCGRPFLNIK
ncbi:hypothetical protein HDU88_008246 [Geranomyces variabilis]|nr:hypothetical protein HDU88_008246 [Geranomyces variabilis]